MTENTTDFVSRQDVPNPPTLTLAHDHSKDVPVTVSEDNVATVNVAADEPELEQYKSYFIKEKTKTVTLQGFRKGKAPESMVARLFKQEARQSARDNVLYTKYMKLLQEHKLQPLSEPKIDHVHDEDGKIFATLIVDVLQPVILGQYMGLELDVMPVRSIEDSLKKTLAEIKQSYPKLTPITEGVVENSNAVTADYVVMDGDKQLEKQENFKITVGQNLYYAPFEAQVIGMSVGENKEFDIEFPADYHKEDFRSKAIHFNLTVKEIKQIGEYTNDELAKVLSYESEEKMAELLTTEIEAKFKDDEHLFFENQILGQLLSSHQFKIPQKILDREIGAIHAEHPEMTSERVLEVADRFVRTDLILHAVYERHPEIQMTQEEFNAKLGDLASKANDTIESTLQKLQAAGKLQRYVDYLTNCKVIDFLIEMADKKVPVAVETPAAEEVTLTTSEEKDNG